MASMKIQILTLLLLNVFSLHARFMDEVQYSLATADAQKNNWEQAEQRINNLIINTPDRPDLLYDAGVIAYHNKKFEQARACFEHGLQCAQLEPSLQEQLCFNAGNTCVELQQLKEAINYYERVLTLNNKHERARHNLEIVKNMLKEQEQKQQQDQDKQKNNNDEQQQQEQNKKQSGNDKQNENEQQNNEGQGSQEQHKEQENGNGNKQKSEPKNQGNEDQEKQNGQENGAKQNKGNSDQRPQQPEANKPNEQKREQQRQQHTDSQSQRNELPQQDKQKTSFAQSRKTGRQAESNLAAARTEEKFDKNEQWMLELLQEQEKADKEANKYILQSLVQKNLAGQDGENCW